MGVLKSVLVELNSTAEKEVSFFLLVLAGFIAVGNRSDFQRKFHTLSLLSIRGCVKSKVLSMMLVFVISGTGNNFIFTG